MQHNAADPEDSLLVLGHYPDSFILIAIDDKTRTICSPKVRQHMTTGNRRDEGLFGIHIRWDRERNRHRRRRRRRRYRSTAIECPGMGTRKAALQKFISASNPSNGCLVFGHSRILQLPSIPDVVIATGVGRRLTFREERE